MTWQDFHLRCGSSIAQSLLEAPPGTTCKTRNGRPVQIDLVETLPLHLASSSALTTKSSFKGNWSFRLAEAPRRTFSTLICALSTRKTTAMCRHNSNLLPFQRMNGLSLCIDETHSASKNKSEWVMHAVFLLYPYVQGSGKKTPFANSHWPYIKVSEVFGVPKCDP